MIFRRELIALMDLKLALEYRDVALRPEHVSVSLLSAAEIIELIEAIEAFAEPVKVSLKIRPLSHDPNDDMVLELAINGHADAIITNNTRHFRAPCKHYGIAVFTPGDFLSHFKKEDQHGG